MKRDFERLMRAASRARGETFLDRLASGVAAWASEKPRRQRTSVSRDAPIRVDVRPVEVVEAELIDE